MSRVVGPCLVLRLYGKVSVSQTRRFFETGPAPRAELPAAAPGAAQRATRMNSERKWGCAVHTAYYLFDLYFSDLFSHSTHC